MGGAVDIFNTTQGLFDVVLIDIDKEGYVEALQAAVPRVRQGGLILADNVLWGGRTALQRRKATPPPLHFENSTQPSTLIPDFRRRFSPPEMVSA